MDIYDILIHPDPRLRKKTQPMAAPIDGLQELIDRMFETMYDAPGVGLAAPQIGVLERIFVMDPAREGEPEPYALINPEIIWKSDETAPYEEGCLSIPEIFEEVSRPAIIKLRYRDRDFNEQEVEWGDFHATVAQHEFDHLNGKLFIDYLSPLKRQIITKKMEKLKRDRARDAKAKL